MSQYHFYDTSISFLPHSLTLQPHSLTLHSIFLLLGKKVSEKINRYKYIIEKLNNMQLINII